VTAENDTPRKIAAELEKSGPRDGAGRRALQAGQIVELNRRQYPTLLMTSKLRKDTLIFLGASAQAGGADGVDAGLGSGVKNGAGAISVALGACKQLPPSSASPRRDTGVGEDRERADMGCHHVRVSGSRQDQQSADHEGAAETTAVGNTRQASSVGCRDCCPPSSPSPTRTTLAMPSPEGAGAGQGTGAIRGTSDGVTVAEAKAGIRVSIALDGGD